MRDAVLVVLALAESDCERLREGWLAQPANAVSSLAYVAVGLWLLGRSRGGGVRHGVVVAAGGAMVGAGLGSVAYHGPQPGWADPVHDLAVAALVLVVAGMTIGRMAGPGGRQAAVAAWVGAAPWMAAALVAYGAGRAGSPLCHPAALWQPHAAWHVLSAVGLGSAVLGHARPAGRKGPDDENLPFGPTGGAGRDRRWSDRIG